jgi:3-oxoacyl-[acyl-carrier protein] reductase
VSPIEPVTRARLEFAVNGRLVEQFAAITGDRSSLHTDEAFARRSLYRRPVAHGILPVSYLLLCQVLARPGCDARVAKISAKFIAPAHVDDALALVVDAANDADEAHGVFTFHIERRETREVLTRGSVTLAYAPGRASSARASAERASAWPQVDSLASVAMRALSIADLVKGDTDAFELSVTRELEHRLIAMLARGLPASAASGPVAAAAFDPCGMLAVASLSTLVGMRLPGATATFLEFEAEMNAPIELDRAYRLEGRIAHVSRGTSLLKIDVSIATQGSSVGAVRGRIAVLVNEPARQGKSADELRAAAMDLGLRDKVVLITGASRGIGETTAKLFALLGAKVVLNYRRSKADAERIVSEIATGGGVALALKADVADREQVAAMVDAAVARFGGIDVLVNNAVRDFRSIAYADLAWDEIQADLDVTLKGAFNCAKLVVPHMLKRGGGKIVNISSIYAENPPPDQLKYVVSKAALEGLARALAAELAGQNIQVNTVVPSFVDTEVSSRMHDALRKRKAQQSPMGRNASPEDVAHAVLFLASSFSSYTTGQRILVTGGGAPYL